MGPRNPESVGEIPKRVEKKEIPNFVYELIQVRAHRMCNKPKKHSKGFGNWSDFGTRKENKTCSLDITR